MPKIRVAIYPRVSTQEQAREGYSIGEQIDRLTKYSEAMNWTIYKIYTDPGYSGGDLNRPGLQDMLKDIKAGKIDKVLVYKLDRLSRSQKDTLMLIEDEFIANGVDFVSMSENFDTSTPFGRAMIGILAVFAQLEREQIKDRMSLGREARIKKGLYHGSANIAIGYDYIDGELKVNDYESMLIKEIFNLFNAGVSVNKITEILNTKGLQHRSGAWIPSTVKRLLSNRTYIGEVRYRGDTWYPGIHEPIIDLDTFNISQARLKKTSELALQKENYGKHTTILGGLLYCSKCGAKYVKATSGRRKDGSSKIYYTCNSRAKKIKSGVKDPNCKNKTRLLSQLEEEIFNEIRKLKVDPDYFKSLKNDPTPEDNKEDLIKKEIEDLKDKISGYMDLYVLKKISIDDIDAKISPLSDRVDKLESELKEIQNKKETQGLGEDQTIQLINSFEDILKRGNFDEIRLTVSALIDHIELNDEDIIIYWNFS